MSCALLQEMASEENAQRDVQKRTTEERHDLYPQGDELLQRGKRKEENPADRRSWVRGRRRQEDENGLSCEKLPKARTASPTNKVNWNLA